MGLLKKYFNNTRRPEGLLGKILLRDMNKAHAAVSDWGLSQLTGLKPAAIADLGCGGGRNVARLLELFPSAVVTAVDYAEVSVAKTIRFNRREILQGRCQVLRGDVSSLPLEEGVLDLVTAFETVYFWPGPVTSFREVCRVLKPEGLFLIVNDSDGSRPDDRKWCKLIDGMRIYDSGQLTAYLKEAGFGEVIMNHDAARHRLCLLAKKEKTSFYE